MAEKQQQLVLAIIDFLNQSINDGTVRTDDKESLDVAIQCIAEAFGVDPSDQDQVEQLGIKPATLQSIFDVYLKTRDRMGAQPQSPTSNEPTKANKENAEKLKQEGNTFMSSKKYDEAIEAYTKAIAHDSTNPVYYSNRAAAHSSKSDHLAAVGDAEKAISVDPKFVKAYHRLGHAQYSLGDYNAAADAFERGLKHDESNTSLKTGLQNAQTRIAADASTVRSPAGAGADAGAAPNVGAMADILRNMGGAGRGGGMPDLASLMNNPQVMAMAQQLAANGGLSNLMQNPSVANMMNRVQSGDMPSMAELMSDPSLRDMANQFTQGGDEQGSS
ncbi:cytoplasmic protein [Amanita muscaria]